MDEIMLWRFLLLGFILMFASGSAPDPYTITEMNDPTILPGYRNVDGLTQVDPRLVSGESTAVIVVGGQSILANYSQTSYTPTNAKVQFLNIYNGGVYRAGAIPLAGTGGNLDNFAKRMADKMITAGKYTRIILVPIAVGSTTFANWAAGGVMNHRLGVTAKRLASLGLTATHVIWGQGESDNVNATSQASCTASINSIIATIRGTIGSAPVYVASESYYLGATAANVTAAQAAVVTGTVFAGPNMDSIGSGGRYDNIHLNATGADTAAGLWATLLP